MVCGFESHARHQYEESPVNQQFTGLFLFGFVAMFCSKTACPISSQFSSFFFCTFFQRFSPLFFNQAHISFVCITFTFRQLLLGDNSKLLLHNYHAVFYTNLSEMKGKRMSRLEFDGMQKTITLYNAKEEVIGNWEAQNNIVSSKEMRHIPDGTYIIQDKANTHMHPEHPEYDTINNKYGTYGIVRFYMPETSLNKQHNGVGVHSGRAFHPRKPGPQHPTEGCIRTNEDAMKSIHDLIPFDNLTIITVINNLPKKGSKK